MFRIRISMYVRPAAITSFLRSMVFSLSLENTYIFLTITLMHVICLGIGHRLA